MMYEEIFKREVEAVKSLGDQIGYGNMMEIASALWAKAMIDTGHPYDGVPYPTLLSNMIPSDLTDHRKESRKMHLEWFDKWGIES